MTPHQKALIVQSYGRVLPMSDETGEMFYTRLFVGDPELQKLFVGTIAERAHSLMLALSLVVRSLDQVETLVPTLHGLGARHRAYGVKADHYAKGGDALLWALAQALGDDFTPDVREAWHVAYMFITTIMQEGA